MKFKETLENKLRGWFPKDGNLLQAPAKVDLTANRKPSVVNLETGAVRVIHEFVVLAVITLSVGVLAINPISSMLGTSAPRWGAIAAICGLAVGVVFSVLSTKLQLKHLEKGGKYSMNLKTLFILSILVALIFSAPDLLFINQVGSFILVNGISSTVIFAGLLSYYLSTCVMFFAYEKRKNVYLIGYWLRNDFYAVSRTSAMRIKYTPMLDLSLGSKSGARTITILALILALSLLGTCYYSQLIDLDLLLLGLIITIVGSAGLSLALSLTFKKQDSVKVDA